MKKINEYLMIKEAAKYLGVSPNTLRAWEREGKITVHRHPFSGYRLYDKEALDYLLERINVS